MASTDLVNKDIITYPQHRATSTKQNKKTEKQNTVIMHTLDLKKVSAPCSQTRQKRQRPSLIALTVPLHPPKTETKLQGPFNLKPMVIFKRYDIVQYGTSLSNVNFALKNAGILLEESSIGSRKSQKTPRMTQIQKITLCGCHENNSLCNVEHTACILELEYYLGCHDKKQ